MEDSTLPVEATFEHQPPPCSLTVFVGPCQTLLPCLSLLFETLRLVALANRRLSWHEFEHLWCGRNHALGQTPPPEADLCQGFEFESLGNVDRLVGSCHLGRDSVPELVVDLSGFGHSHAVATGGLQRMVLLAQRMKVAEPSEPSPAGIEVEERDDVVDLRLLGPARATRDGADRPLFDQRPAQVVGNLVARRLCIERGAGGGVSEDPLDGLRPSSDHACHLGGHG